MTFQKNVPSLMVDGFALVLQMLVGFTLVSFYHPMLFAFNLVLILVMYAIWKIWGTGAKRSAIELSHAKYDSAKWLNDIAAAHEFLNRLTMLNMRVEVPIPSLIITSPNIKTTFITPFPKW